MTENAVSFSGITDTGRKRDHNEDCFAISETGHWAILADGMGGRMFGEVASSMAVSLLEQRFESFFHPAIRSLSRSDQSHAADMIITTLDEWIRDVNQVIWSKGQAEDKYREMGTTLALVYALPNVAVIAHVGDSRCYLIRDETIKQITVDHSLVNSQVETGMITREEAANSAQKNIITRAVGTARTVKPDFDVIHMQKNDCLVICSDGLTDMVDDETIRRTISASSDDKKALKNLVELANANGGRDNITILLVRWPS